MGTSGAMSTSNTYVKYNISIFTNWQDVSGNYSSVKVRVYFWRTNSGYQTYGTGTVYCKINGTTYSASVGSSQKITNSGITLFERDVNVGHNTDGSKYLDTSAWISLNTPLTSSEQWYGEWFSTIPRASQPSLSNSSVTMENNVTIYTNRASSSFTHVLYRQIGGGGWTTIATGIGTSYTWTVPTSLASSAPNSTALSLNMILETYSGGTHIGTKSVTLTANVPSSFVPTINSVTLSEAVEGIADKFGGYVQGKSKIKSVVSASGVSSSTISKYQSTTNSQTFTTSTFTTNEITNSGNQLVSTTVTDSRGRTAINATSYFVVPYSSPTITNFNATRANSSGIIDDKGNYVLYTINAGISPVNNFNDKLFLIKYKKTNETNYTSINITPSGTDYTFDDTYLISNIDVDYTYDFTLELSDYFSSVSQSRAIPTAFTLVDYNASGRGMAIGKVSTHDSTFNVALTSWFEKGCQFDDLAYFQGTTTFTNTNTFSGATTISGEKIIFESGSWTPSLRSRSGTNPSYSVQYRYGKYKRFNNLCYISFHGKYSISNGGTDYACVTGLPYTSSNGMNGQSLALHEMFGGINRDPDRVGIVPDNSTRIDLQGLYGTYASQWSLGDTWIGFSGVYMIAT